MSNLKKYFGELIQIAGEVEMMECQNNAGQ